MGNYKFRLSDMMPNVWFYKLKDRKQKQNPHSSSSSSITIAADSSKSSDQSHLSDQRKSYYFTRDLNTSHPNSPTKTIIISADKQEPPRKSSRRRRSTKRSRMSPRFTSSTVSAGCSCRTTLESVWTKLPDSTPEEYPDVTSSSEHDSMLPEYDSSDRGLTPDTLEGMLSWSTSCQCRIKNDIINDADKKKPSLNLSLPPIMTKKPEPTKIQRTSAEFSEKNAYGSLSVKVVKEDFLNNTAAAPHKTAARRQSSSPGVRLRTNSPKIAHRRIQGRKSVSESSSSGSRRSVSESFAVVKTSKDPRRDFRESMVEMIVENNIRASKDLEELLACYLSLNSDEYHDLIINVFKQIWFDFIRLRFK